MKKRKIQKKQRYSFKKKIQEMPWPHVHKVIGMIVIGLAAVSFHEISYWFVIPWTIGWLIYEK